MLSSQAKISECKTIAAIIARQKNSESKTIDAIKPLQKFLSLKTIVGWLSIQAKISEPKTHSMLLQMMTETDRRASILP